MKKTETFRQLRRQGVEIPAPETVYIGEEVALECIQGPGTVLFPGTRLSGEKLKIMPGCRIGEEGLATVNDCALARNVSLKAGYFTDSTFLDGASMGLGAHVRLGTLLEEEANGAHTVGLKQTILMPFVTLGSLINFCDILMAGGTSRRDHSEVGSSFIHFNFTPYGRHGDKATASLVGDVARGVMLRSPRIFLGGQAGLVGPVFINYGTVLAAGYVYRQDHGPDELIVGERIALVTLKFNPQRLNRMRARLERNLRYMGNLIALWHWYQRVRLPHAAHDPILHDVYLAAQGQIEKGIQERIKQLSRLADYAEDSIRELEKEGRKHAREIAVQQAFLTSWPEMETELKKYQIFATGEETEFAVLWQALQQTSSKSYVEAIQSLAEETAAAGTAWLQGIVERTINPLMARLDT